MTLNLTQMTSDCVADSQLWFPGVQTIPNLTLCLAGEVGEAANIVKKVERGDYSYDMVQSKLAAEYIDVQVYLCNIFGNPVFKGIDWEREWNRKRAFNASRFRHPSSRGDTFVLEQPGKVVDITDALLRGDRIHILGPGGDGGRG